MSLTVKELIEKASNSLAAYPIPKHIEWWLTHEAWGREKVENFIESCKALDAAGSRLSEKQYKNLLRLSGIPVRGRPLGYSPKTKTKSPAPVTSAAPVLIAGGPPTPASSPTTPTNPLSTISMQDLVNELCSRLSTSAYLNFPDRKFVTTPIWLDNIVEKHEGMYRIVPLEFIQEILKEYREIFTLGSEDREAVTVLIDAVKFVNESHF